MFLCVTISPLSTNASVWSDTGHCCLCLFVLDKTLFNVGLFTILSYFITVSAYWRLEWLRKFIPLTVWKCHIFRKVPTSLSTFDLMRIIYTCRFQPSHNGNDLFVSLTFLRFPEIDTHAIISSEPALHRYTLNLELTSYNTQSYRESLLSFRSSLLHCALYKWRTAFNSVLILGLSFLHYIGAYSWVENNSSLSRTHVARSNEQHLARFFYIDLSMEYRQHYLPSLVRTLGLYVAS